MLLPELQRRPTSPLASPTALASNPSSFKCFLTAEELSTLGSRLLTTHLRLGADIIPPLRSPVPIRGAPVEFLAAAGEPSIAAS